MVYTGLKNHQGEPPLGLSIYTLKRNEGHEGKKVIFWGLVLVGDGRAKGKGK
jgi:hypothetical protein